MAETLYGFNADGTRRVVAATRKVEGMAPATRGGLGTGQLHTPRSFWIELTAAGSTSGFYNWKMVYYNPATSAWVDMSPAVTGTNTARDSNLTTGLYSASPAKRYLAHYYGQNGSNLPVYIFTGVGSGLPTGTGESKVLQLVDGLTPGTPGWDYLEFP